VQAEPDQRAPPPAHATGVIEFIALADIADDGAFRLRPEGDVAALATSLGRLGQLAPVELRPVPWPRGEADPAWQVVAGFRRLAAVRLLARERVLARVHRELPDRDAWDLALVDALLHEPLGGEELRALRERMDGVAPWAGELVDEALVRRHVVPAPPPAGTAPVSFAPDEIVEVTPEELVQDLTGRLYALNQDLATAFEAWEDLPAEGRQQLVEQARYVVALLPFMEAKQ
jgi:ParB family transcriptional regulator, chromosome partitioning protein